MSLSHSIMPLTTKPQAENEKISIIRPELKNVIFGHYPCPDGISALICLKEKYGKTETTYVPFNHGPLEKMRETILSATKGQDVNIIFADIAPKHEIIKEILEKTNCTITILDHHDTVIEQIRVNRNYLDKFASAARLHIVLDPKRSGVGISYDYVNEGKVYPPHIALIQAIDVYTATADIGLVREKFDPTKLALDDKAKELMKKCTSLTSNQVIKDNIEFFVIAGILDIEMKKIMTENQANPFDTLMQTMENFFVFLQEHGVSSLLQSENIMQKFQKQLDYQNLAIDSAVVIPSGISTDLDVLFVDANIQTGRTFDPLLEETLRRFSRPTIAVVANTSDKNPEKWASLRAHSAEFDLTKIAAQYMSSEFKFAKNAGGHKRASAIQLTTEQLKITFTGPVERIRTKSSALGSLNIHSTKKAASTEFIDKSDGLGIHTKLSRTSGT